MNKPERLLVRPLDAAAMLSVGRSKIYELIQQGIVPSTRIGGLLRVPREALEKLAVDAMNPAPERQER